MKIIKQVFEDIYFLERNGWFFEAKWKDAKIETFEDDGGWLFWEDGIWHDGVWDFGIWNNGIWNNGKWINGIWNNGIWNNGKWINGTWKDGVWKEGTWIAGKIYDPKTGKYKESLLSPNECIWSLSYDKYNVSTN